MSEAALPGSRRAAGGYFALQGCAVAAWWLVLALVPRARVMFVPGGAPEAALMAFALPDLALLAVSSLVGGWLLWRGAEAAGYVLFFACGCVSYATLYCLSFALLTDRGWIAVTMMLPAMLLSLACALSTSPVSVRLLRRARHASRGCNLVKTALQIVVIWGLVLFVIPALLRQLQVKVGPPLFWFSLQQPLAACLFLGLSALGLWSGFTMARLGDGTPLPLDSPNRLVIQGPYAWVRNPMAMAGLGQGMAAGLWLGSVFVFGYVLIGAWIWQCLARPLEEQDMLLHFGPDYEAYRRQVRCWCPRPSHQLPENPPWGPASVPARSRSGRT